MTIVTLESCTIGKIQFELSVVWICQNFPFLRFNKSFLQFDVVMKELISKITS